nr:hypothetical protein [Tanacetum cinerariifolium]
LDTFTSVRRPNHSGVIWKKKGSSNTSTADLSFDSLLNLNKNVKRYSRKDLLSCNNSHLGETSSAYVCNDAMNVSCNSRMCDFFDDNNLFIFDDESVRISPVSKIDEKETINVIIYIKKQLFSRVKTSVRSLNPEIAYPGRSSDRDFEKIDSPFQQTSSLKPYVPNVILKKIIIDLEDEVVSLLEKEKATLKTVESLKSKGFESSENAISDSENQSDNDCHVVEKACDKVENSKVIAPGLFKLNVSQSVSPISMSKTSCDSNNVESKINLVFCKNCNFNHFVKHCVN